MKTIYYIAIILLVSFSTSCKTQKESVKPDVTSEKRTIHVEEMEIAQEEEKLMAVTPASINAEKVNELAMKKADLLCKLKDLKMELEKTNDEFRKTELNSEIAKLKDEIIEFDNVIKSTFSDQALVDEVEKMVQFLVKDC